ncbi:MAG: PEP-CTERM sorting domain-containing protein [Planctomycetes bacterium]|nr:PEP-CTERM sorting domain-containing protein [Planctomycetota bacterium]MBU4399487.1 PEP-CTERM sorting domain-containing protein [Planctomycetota bacterium]MCG2682396.1 PEP-CTERM sorting domain-containing protein [Planctomycetales bacterium]
MAAAIIGGLALAQTGAAETFDCSLTGYTFMGGGSAYVSTPDGPTGQKTYFLAQPLNYHMGDPPANMWGYGWIKFNDIGDSTLESARLYFDLLGVGAMGTTPASEDNPAVLSIYGAGSIDVSDLGGSDGASWDLRETLRDNLDASSPLCTITMTANGRYSVDITDLYNSWVTGGEAVNNGLVFAAPDEGVGSKYASFGNADGDPPYIVPEPGTIVLVAGAFLGLGLARILRRRRIADVMA